MADKDVAKGEALARAQLSLTGLSIGDAFGERFFGEPTVVAQRIEQRELPDAPWRFTDDTEMALSIVEELGERAEIDAESLARAFARRYDSRRGYGAAMHGLMARIREGAPPLVAAASLFDGQGSFGNGSAMRVAPVGAFFAESLDDAVEQATRSARATHTHPEALAGAVAVAVTAALAWDLRDSRRRPTTPELLAMVAQRVPRSEVRERIGEACKLPLDATVSAAVEALGNGSRISCQDTVAFTLWCAARRLDSYEEALWETVSGLGDRDTTCAIVGGIVALHVGAEGIPEEWIERRERLPTGSSLMREVPTRPDEPLLN